ncbi:MAG TPA: ankyrin repeat domain-containing protein [Candidatus Methylacidiphilales bacterium]|nr:ankyrin repeat domain-containing protein [Candidatus Methylacidiphilales bacterium]
MKHLPVPRKRLPVNPSLEHLQKQAKRLVKQSSAASPRSVKPLTLAVAQHRLAREYGCKHWAELVRIVESMGRTASELTPKKSFNPLPDAANDGDIDRVRHLLAAGDFTQHDLDLALSRGAWNLSRHPERRALGELLLQHGADPNGQYGSNYGPIILSPCEGLDPEGIAFLIEAGADVTFGPIKNKYADDVTPVNAVLSTYVRGRNAAKRACLDLLIRHGARWQDDAIMAIHRGDAAALGVMVDKDRTLLQMHFGANSDSRRLGNINLRGATLLHLAVEFGERECVEALLSRYWYRDDVDMNKASLVIDGVGGQSALYHAIATWDGDVSMLEFLMKRDGKWINPASRASFLLFGEKMPPMTPLEYAMRGVTDETKLGSAKKRELEILRDADTKARLKEAIKREDVAEVSALLDAAPNLLSADLWPVTLFQAKSLSIARLLLDRGLDPNTCSAPRKPLHFAADRKLPEVMALLLSRGADPNIRDGEGYTPLDLYGGLVPGERDEADRTNIALLLGAGARPNLWTWLRLGETERVLGMLREDPELIHARSPDLGFSVLDQASRSADVAVVQYLIANGAALNVANPADNTPLWFACQSGANPGRRLQVLRLLLAAGANVHQLCEDGSTALHFAAWRGPAAAVELLLSHGALPTIADKNGQLPRHYATGSHALTAEEKEAVLALLPE